MRRYADRTGDALPQTLEIGSPPRLLEHTSISIGQGPGRHRERRNYPYHVHRHIVATGQLLRGLQRTNHVVAVDTSDENGARQATG
jgi:hypothetical protein